MVTTTSVKDSRDIEQRIALRLAQLRADKGWSLEALADKTGISRATLSRLERAELSPTAAMLGTLCTVYGWTLSRFMTEAETRPANLITGAMAASWSRCTCRRAHRSRLKPRLSPAWSTTSGCSTAR